MISSHRSPHISISIEWGIAMSSLLISSLISRLICIPSLLISPTVRLLICVPIDRASGVSPTSLLGIPGVLVRVFISSSRVGVEEGLSVGVIRTLLILVLLILAMVLISPVAISREIRFEFVINAAHQPDLLDRLCPVLDLSR